MENLQKCIIELGMRQAIYDAALESPSLVKLSVGMRDLILQQAPPH